MNAAADIVMQYSNLDQHKVKKKNHNGKQTVEEEYLMLFITYALLNSEELHKFNAYDKAHKLWIDKETIASMATADSRLENSIVDTAIQQAHNSSFKCQEFYKTMNIMDNLTLLEKPNTRYDNYDTQLSKTEVKGFQTVYVEIDYQNKINLHNCGIYTIRHMETYYEALLRTLRAKYATQILLHPNNLLRDDTLHEAKLEARARQ
ncbi:hypothetical protein Cgig2_009008 [Carnegiea gigantea]|uniref:Uncharacterized protein n=1 Tax=Carnegiea gigantea TaxID=171969 RepID=A0A9Q1QGX4_9CARY|nr:hypothetical protein Cgig2_009008 [Carnegiea gigantea]